MNITVYPDNDKACSWWHSWHTIIDSTTFYSYSVYSYSECLDCKARRYLSSSTSHNPDGLWLAGKKTTFDMVAEQYRR